MALRNKKSDVSAAVGGRGGVVQEPWYAGTSVLADSDARSICTMLLSRLGTGPRSRGAEYILSALESGSDSHKKAMCLAEVMEHLAKDPSGYYLRMTAKKTDFSSTHGFDHRAGDFYSALGIDEKGQFEVMKIMVEMSKGILQAIFSTRSLSALTLGRVFERALTSYSRKDKKIVAAAIFNLLTAPILRPVTFFPDSEPQSLV